MAKGANFEVMRHSWKQFKHFYLRYINGAKGSISLLLALAVSPLLSITLILVESARYQSVIGLMQELTNSAGFSALAEYDSYLEERYGLMAVDQMDAGGSNLENDVWSFLNGNTAALGGAVTLNSVSAIGRFSLGDTKVLKQQILENSELTVPVELAMEGLDLQKLVENLSKTLKLDELNKAADSVNSCADVMELIATILENSTVVGDEYPIYLANLDLYKGTAYNEFRDAALDYIAKKSAAEQQQTEHESQDGNIVEEVVEDIEESSAECEKREAWEKFTEKRDAYKQAATEFQNSHKTVSDALTQVIDGVKKLPEKLEKAKEASKGNGSQTICDTTTYEWLNSIEKQLDSQLSTVLVDEIKDGTNAEQLALLEHIAQLQGITESSFTSTSSETEVAATYGPIPVTTITQVLVNRLELFLKALSTFSVATEEEINTVSVATDVLNELLGVSLAYNDKLDAVVSDTVMFVESSPNLSDTAGVAAIKNMTEAITKFNNAVNGGGIFEILSAGASFLYALGNFLLALVTWAGKVLARAFEVLFSLDELYNNILLYGYGAYNLPNRLSRDEEGRKSSLSDFSYESIYTMAGGQNGAPSLFGSFESLSLEDAPGSDALFKSAYGEYLMCGFYSETANQSAVAYNLFMFRIVLNLAPVLKTPSVTSVAGPVGIAIKVGYLLLESLIDTVMLVNGNSEYLFKETIYLSPAGLVILADELRKLTTLGEKLVEDMKPLASGDSPKTPTKKGLFESDYTDHLLLMLMLTLSQDEYLRRMQNVIQMECAEKYKTEGNFSLNKAYTNLYGTVDYTLEPWLDLDGLSDRSLLTVERNFSMGY